MDSGQQFQPCIAVILFSFRDLHRSCMNEADFPLCANTKMLPCYVDCLNALLTLINVRGQQFQPCIAVILFSFHGVHRS